MLKVWLCRIVVGVKGVVVLLLLFCVVGALCCAKVVVLRGWICGGVLLCSCPHTSKNILTKPLLLLNND